MKHIDLYKRGIKLHGLRAQFDQTMEESAELIVAIRRFLRGRVGVQSLVEEITDVRMMCNMLEECLKQTNDEQVIDGMFKDMEYLKHRKYTKQLDEES